MDNISSYRFDFRKEVTDLRRRLGHKTDNIYFLEIDVSQSKNGSSTLSVKPRHLIGDPDLEEEAVDGAILFYNKNPSHGSVHFDVKINEKIISHEVNIRRSEPFYEVFGKKNKDLMRLFMLYHETAHALISDLSITDNHHPFMECAADAYAALSLFQQFGPEAKNILSMVSWLRSYDALHGDTSHLTSPVLDKIITDSSKRDFSNLTSNEMIKLARNYATAWTPKSNTIRSARKSFGGKGRSTDITDLLSSTCLSSSASALAFYVGAKVAHPYLQPEGFIKNPQAVQFSDEMRQQYASAIEERTKAFNARAKKSAAKLHLTEPLKVSLPRGQRQLVIKV